MPTPFDCLTRGDLVRLLVRIADHDRAALDCVMSDERESATRVRAARIVECAAALTEPHRTEPLQPIDTFEQPEAELDWAMF